MKTILAIFVAAMAVILTGVGFAYSGVLDVSASSPHGAIVSWYMSTTAHASIKRQAVNVVVPDLANDQLVLAGINDYEVMCVECHGAPGKRPGPVGQGLNPPAPKLAESAQRMSAAELFWVTKHGIKMTGMPAWGATHDDNAIWPVVAFTAKLPELDAQGYRKLLSTAAGHGHHANDSANTEQKSVEGAEMAADQIHVHDDNAAHTHENPAESDESQELEHGTHDH